jgi:hypothetical protein
MGVAVAALAEPAPSLGPGGKMHLRGVLDGQNMAPDNRLAGAFAPAVDDLFRRHLLIGEEPPSPQAAFACLVETPVADRLGRQHLFKDDTASVVQARIPEGSQ